MSAEGTSPHGLGETSVSCTLHGLMHSAAGPDTALPVQLDDSDVDAWFVSDTYDTSELRRRGYTELTPNPWVNTNSIDAAALTDVRAAGTRRPLALEGCPHGHDARATPT